MSSIITHESIYDLLSKEKTRIEIQSINPEFFKQLESYIEEKEFILKSQKEKNTFPDEVKKTERQLLNIRRLSDELVERRKKKILDLAMMNSKSLNPQLPKNLLPLEIDLYESVLNSLKSYILPLKKEIIEAKALKNENSLKSIKFIHPIPKFMGTDGKVYGPFENEDIAVIPEDIANLLINKKMAEIHETSETD